MGTNLISDLQINKFNPAVLPTVKPAVTPTGNLTAPSAGSVSRVADYNSAGAAVKAKLFGTNAPLMALKQEPPVGAPLPPNLNLTETKSISDVAYDGKTGEVYHFDDGTYWRADRAEQKDSGFKAVVMRRVVSDGSGGYVDDPTDNRAVVGFAGTNGIDDIDDDVKQALGVTPAQYDQALAFTQQVQGEAAATGETIQLTGHSLGGGLAGYCSIQTGLQATGLNSAPLSNNKVPDGVNYDNQITQFHSKGEILTDLDNINPTDTRPGKDVEVNAAHDEISHWWDLLSFGGTEVANLVISGLNHTVSNTAPEIKEPDRVYP